MQLIEGLVTDVEDTSYVSSKNVQVSQLTVYVSAGRRTVATVGEDRAYRIGEPVLLSVTYSKPFEKGDIQARRIFKFSRETAEQVSKLVDVARGPIDNEGE